MNNVLILFYLKTRSFQSATEKRNNRPSPTETWKTKQSLPHFIQSSKDKKTTIQKIFSTKNQNKNKNILQIFTYRHTFWIQLIRKILQV